MPPGLPQRIGTVAFCLFATAAAFAPLAYGIVGLDVRVVALVGNALATSLVLAVRLPRDAAMVVAPAAGLFAGVLSGALVGTAVGPGITFVILLMISVGILDGMGGTRASGLVAGLRLAGSVAIWLLLALLPMYGGPVVIAGLAMTVHVGALAGIDWPRRGARGRWWPAPLAFAASSTGIAFFTHYEGAPLIEALIAFPLGSVLVFGCGRLLALWLAPRVQVLTELVVYLRAMWIPLGGFVIGYMFLVAIFAGVFATLHRVDPLGAFAGVSAGSAGDWLFFSIATATTLGDPTVHAVSLLARMVVGLEAIAATCWLIAVFAAVTAHVQPLFARIAERRAATP